MNNSFKLSKVILVSMLVIAGFSCKKDESKPLFQGGYIAYTLQSGDPGYITGESHGIIAAPEDQSTFSPWGCVGTIIAGADGIVLGTGNQNTIDIVTGCTSGRISARICNELELNGFSDWYLPSKDELNKLYLNQNEIGGFEKTVYASSTEYAGNEVYDYWSQDLNNGVQSYTTKAVATHVRCIRSY